MFNEARPVPFSPFYVNFEVNSLRKSLLTSLTLERLYVKVDGCNMLVQIPFGAKAFVAITANTWSRDDILQVKIKFVGSYHVRISTYSFGKLYAKFSLEIWNKKLLNSSSYKRPEIILHCQSIHKLSSTQSVSQLKLLYGNS